jgi:hypothetical protein
MIAQRPCSVSIRLDADASILGSLRHGLSVTARVHERETGAHERRAPVLARPSARSDELSMQAKVFAFATMSVGFFMALLDIQIVSASLGEIGGGLSAGPDEIAWVQTSYLIAEIVVIPLSGWLSRVMSTR